ncbi:hypothetical protein Acsp06_45040 [Actinomycetospora sp. NBRC 106375]|uniref:hypothetical protein n=1 Tax=Actinomycetospora sp. NBRC 106375 TaxID=3032207 RepID=UPI0024A5F11A|nr:hypothetical protein [Actinomycetospora sp. NBRC 106375]GLZ48319.1 hypothetical protein Acsp06_45040 [Actinomycetospora sp. NBRC 106375]
MFDDALRHAYDALLDAAATVDGAAASPPDGEWDADEILAHVALVTGATLHAVAAVTAGAHTTYDNRLALDPWTIGNLAALCGGGRGLRERIRRQGDALCLLGADTLTDAELATGVPTRLLSHGELLVDRTLTLADILDGLTTVELPGHTQQLLALGR